MSQLIHPPCPSLSPICQAQLQAPLSLWTVCVCMCVCVHVCMCVCVCVCDRSSLSVPAVCDSASDFLFPLTTFSSLAAPRLLLLSSITLSGRRPYFHIPSPFSSVLLRLEKRRGRTGLVRRGVASQRPPPFCLGFFGHCSVINREIIICYYGETLLCFETAAAFLMGDVGKTKFSSASVAGMFTWILDFCSTTTPLCQQNQKSHDAF